MAAPPAQPAPPAPPVPPAPPAPSAPTTDPRHSLILVEGLSPGERFMGALWRLAGQPLMRMTFHNWYGVRRLLLICFGARIHPTARIRPTVRIGHPWRLIIGRHTAVGDHAILFCLGSITIGERCTISQYAHLCSATFDYTRRDMPLLTRPIVVEDDAWIAADVFVAPGVTVGRDSVVGARSTVLHSLPPRTICAGDNARPVRERIIRWPPPQAGAQQP